MARYKIMQQPKNTKKPPARNLHTLTPKQQTILHLLYRYRFLDRSHIQHFLNHKDHKTVIQWLNNLTKTQFIHRSYSSNFPDNTKPAVYNLATKGIAWLKTQPSYDIQTLHKLYREHERSATFIASSLLLATLELKLREQPADAIQQTMLIKSDYPALSQANQLSQLAPSAFIAKTEATITKYYFLELLPESPSTRIRKRLKQYLAFYESNEWESATSLAFPTILLACASLPDLIETKRFLRHLLVERDATTLEILTTTQAELKTAGLTGEIWEEIN